MIGTLRSLPRSVVSFKLFIGNSERSERKSPLPASLPAVFLPGDLINNLSCIFVIGVNQINYVFKL